MGEKAARSLTVLLTTMKVWDDPRGSEVSGRAASARGDTVREAARCTEKEVQCYTLASSLLLSRAPSPFT